ncbi:MAG: glycosyltransferase [Chloroflexi bacterium]|nr:glycosyltransferase [Chloroflexota bacterium]
MSVASPPSAVALERRFVPLDPWIDPPEPRLLAMADVEVWRRLHAVPLRFDGQGLWVAAGEAATPATAAELQARTGQRVHLEYAARDEVDFWIDVLSGRRTWTAALVDSLGELLKRLHLQAVQESPLSEDSEGALPVASIMRAFGLTEGVATEVLALRARRPQVRLGRYAANPVLGEILPHEAAEAWQVAPLAAWRGTLLLASPGMPGRGALASLGRLAGLNLSVAIAAPSAFDQLLRKIYGEPESEPASSSGSDDEALLDALVRAGALDAERRTALERVTSVSNERRSDVALRLGFVDRGAVQAARARTLGLQALDPGTATVDAAHAALAAAPLWRRWRCIPVQRGGQAQRVTLAVDGPFPARRQAMLSSLLEVGTVQCLYLDPPDLDALLDTAATIAPHREPYTVEAHLTASGLVARGPLAEARRVMDRDTVGLVQALRDTRAVTEEDLVEARAIVRGRAWIHLGSYAPDPAVADLVPEDVARAELGVALRRHGPSITVAMLDGRDDPTPGVIERATGLAFDPVLALAEDPDAALERWYAHAHVQDEPLPPLPPAYDEFGRFLVRRGLLTREALESAWRLMARRNLPVDVALAEPTLLQPRQVVQALRTHLAIEEADLNPRPRRVEKVDALGQTRVDTAWDDPVERDAARLISRSVAERSSALPFQVADGGAVAVAFANPLDHQSLERVEAALGRPMQVYVAPRQELLVAQRRVYASKSVGERLLESGTITRQQLARALAVHDQSGIRVGKALVNLGFIAEDELASTLAQQADLPFVDLRAAEPDEAAARMLPKEMERARGVLPLYDDGERVVVACTDLPEAVGIDDVIAVLGRPVQPVIVTETAFDDALNALYRDEYLLYSATSLVSRAPEDSSRWVLSRGQKRFFWLLLVALGFSLVLAPMRTMIWIMGLSTLFYVGFSMYKFYLAYRAIAHTLEVETSAEEVALLDDRFLPIYTILVPVYKEANVFPILAKAIDRLDYPKAKLDVKILLEEDDNETIEVARASHLPSHFKLVVVPNGKPKGKPKACNYGLIHAQGEYVVIYDAEDIPEPDQLKKAIVAFTKDDDKLACVQAKLNYFNRDQNLLTRWFTTEYSMWFDLFLPGLDASGAPIPLGGTSNHFRTARLQELGAWDPHNVTEDADLGMRLYKAGWKTAVIDSTTYEEANSDTYNWIRQRSRWVKGYVQTYLVHMRHPVRLWRAIGPKAFFSFQFVIGGTFFGFLMNPVFWFLTALWFLTRAGFIRELFPPPIFYIGAVGLYFGNFAFTYLNVAGCLRRGYYDMVKYALLSPIYWALMSVAAWKGFLQLFYAPSYWEKTNHGLYKGGASHVAEVGLESGAS